MTKLNLSNVGKGNKTNTGFKVAGKVELNDGVWNYFLRQNNVDEFKFFGTLYKGEKDTEDYISFRVSWDVSYAKCTITKPGLTKEDVADHNETERFVSATIIEKEVMKKSKFKSLIDKYKDPKAKTTKTVVTPANNIIDEEEIAVTLEVKNPVEAATKTKAVLPKEVKAFMKEQGCTKPSEALELAVRLYNELKSNNNTLIADIQQEDPNDDPNGGQSIPVVPVFDTSELKATLKSEILAELREELKNSSPEIIKEEIKKEKKEETLNIKTTDYSAMRESNITYTDSLETMYDESIIEEKELSAVESLEGKTFADPAKQKMAEFLLNSKAKFKLNS